MGHAPTKVLLLEGCGSHLVNPAFWKPEAIEEGFLSFLTCIGIRKNLSKVQMSFSESIVMVIMNTWSKICGSLIHLWLGMGFALSFSV